MPLQLIRKLRRSLFRMQLHSREALGRVLVGRGLALGHPILVAVGWRIGMFPRPKITAQKFGRKKLVILGRPGGNEDIASVYNNCKASYAVLFLSRELVKQSGLFFLKEMVSDRNYWPANVALEEAKQQYRLHLIQVLRWFQRLFGLSAMVNFNITYWAERELSAACEGQGVPWVTVHKESNWAPAEIDSRISFFTDSVRAFAGNAISVYNDVTKEILTKADVIEADRVYVSGCARVDESHRIRQGGPSPKSKTVLFYLIDPTAGLGQFKDEKSGQWLRGCLMPDGSLGSWAEMVKKVNEAIISIASDYPEIRFICKAKTQFQQEQGQALVAASPQASLPDNIDLIALGAGHVLLKKATVVIGFNTTAVLEAMASGVPVIIPNIFTEHEKRMAGFAHDVNEGALVVTSPEELRTMVVEAVEKEKTYTHLTSARKNVLNRIMGNSDGRSGERLRALLDNAVLGKL